MNLARSRTHLVVVAALGAGAFAACGGASTSSSEVDGGTLDGGTTIDGSTNDSSTADARSGDGSIPPVRSQAILSLSGGAAAGCATVPPLTVGDFGDASMGVAPRPVIDGTSEAGKVVSITCRVAPSAGGFAFDATIAVAGDATLTLEGATDALGKATGGRMTLRKASTTWSSTMCTFDAGALAPSGGVAAGRYWALMTCSGATSDTGAMCDIFGQLRVENCTQS